MIISHRYKFIFFKTTRVAGTSVEAALSHICGPDDIWTEAGKEGSEYHRAPGGSGYKIPLELREPYWWLRRLGWSIRPIRRKIMLNKAEYSGTDYWAHIPARHVRATLPREIWDSYYKITIERNPWDRLVSGYYYRYADKKKRPSFEEVVRATNRPQNAIVYTIDGEIVVDKFMKFETLADDFREFLQKVGAPSELSIPMTNASKRPDGAYRAMYTDELRDIVAEVHHQIIEYCGYTF